MALTDEQIENIDPVRPVAAAKLLRAHIAGDRNLVVYHLATNPHLELISGLMSIAVGTGSRWANDVDQLDAHLRDTLETWAAEDARKAI